MAHPILAGDPNRLRQIITNLLGNALKFTERGQVVVSAQTLERDGLVEFIGEVRDTGIGIAEDKLLHLFEAFSQADATTTRRFGGTGLGLTIVRQLCQLMGGDASVTSELGKGSCFRFTVCCGSVAPVSINTRFDNKNLLVIEPNQEAGERYYDLLSSVGANVVVTQDFDEGLSLLNMVCADSEEGAEQGSPAPVCFNAALVNISPAHTVQALMAGIASSTKAQQVPILCLASSNSAHEVESLKGKGIIRGLLHKPAPSQYVLRALNELFTSKADSWVSDAGWADGQVAANHSTDGEKTFTGLTVLLVEDNPINQEVAVELLEDFGVVVTIANNGQEAIDALKNSPLPDIVLMDCQMPVRDGFSATEGIRLGDAGKNATQIPIIAMTANAMAGDKERCLRAGMNDYLTKPIDVDLLQMALSQWSVSAAEQKQAAVKSRPEASKVISNNQADQVWDYEGALKRVRGKPERLMKLAQRFQEGCTGMLGEVRECAEQENWPQFTDACHALKGVAANMGAQKLSASAADLERLGKIGEFMDASERLAILEADTQEFVLLLKRFEQDPQAFG